MCYKVSAGSGQKFHSTCNHVKMKIPTLNKSNLSSESKIFACTLGEATVVAMKNVPVRA